MEFPPIAWFILVLGVAWLVLRMWSRRAEERRREEREERMARLYAERARLQEAERAQMRAARPRDPDAAPPSSLAATTSDPGDRASAAPKERRCLGCGAINDGSAKTCETCGFEL